MLYAQDAAEANRLVLDIARENNVKSVVKAKSMVSEEMELNHKLAAAGIRPLETDLGEYLVQLANQRPVQSSRPPCTSAEDGPLVSRQTGRRVHAEHRA